MTHRVVWHRFEDLLRRWSCLGCRTIPDRALLIGHVPHVGPEAFLHVLFSALAESQIAVVEGELGVCFPNNLRQFFRFTNGLHLFSDALSVLGLRTSYVRVGDESWQPYDIIALNSPYEKPRDAPPDLIVIGGYNWDGSHLCFNESSAYPDRIFRCSRESAKPLNVWDDFWSMLESEVVRLSQHFDDQGRQIDPQRPTTP